MATELAPSGQTSKVQMEHNPTMASIAGPSELD